MKQDQNLEKAIEIRLEGEVGEYYVIVAGLTVQLRAIGVGDIEVFCTPTDYYLLENEFYQFHTYYDYAEALAAYERDKEKYLYGTV
jgi:hypothetical protein